MAEAKSYLHFLKFDPKLKQTFIAKYLLNPRLVVLLTIVTIGIGLYSFYTLPRTLNPEIKIPIVIVNVVLPGAGPSDVESLVTIPVENAVLGLANVQTVTSNSINSDSITQIQFNSGVDPDKALSDVQAAVNGITALPKDAQTPQVTKVNFANVPIWTFAVSSNGDTGSLMRYAKSLQDRIKSLSSINTVNVSGLDQQEIQIVIKPESVATYGLNPLQISQFIATAIQAYPAGSVSTDKETYALTLDQEAASINDLRNIQVNLNGSVVPLSQVANIFERPKPDQVRSFLATKSKLPKPVVSFSIFKTDASSIDQAYSDTQKLIANELPIQNGQFQVYTTSSATQQIADQFNELTRDFVITILLVFFVLFVFLGVRQAIIASLAVPITFLIGFTIMRITGLSLSFISLFSLLLALGLLVDDTIVVVSAMTAYYRSGKFTAAETGLLVWRDFLLPILTTTTTTVWAFLPLLLATGIIGEFIKPIPIVVSSTLIASIFVALLITLPFVIFMLEPQIPNRVKIFLRIVGFLILILLIFSFLPKGPFFLIELLAFVVFAFCIFVVRDILVKRIKQGWLQLKKRFHLKRNFDDYINDGLIHFTIISNKYHRVIENILSSKTKRRNTIIMAIAFSLFSYILLPLGFVRNEFFPKSDQDSVAMSLELPAGVNVQTSTQYSIQFLKDLRKIEGVDFVTSDIGQTADTAMGSGGSAGTNDILFSLVLPPKAQRTVSSLRIGQILRDKYNNYPNGKITVVESSGGPPAGADIQIKLFGSDLNTLDQYANRLENYLKTQPGVVNIDKTIKPGTSKLVFAPDLQKMANLQIGQDTLGTWLRLFASGLTVNSVQWGLTGTDKEDITIRMNSNTQNPESVSNISIPTQSQGQSGVTNVPIANLGQMKVETNPTLITREAGKRTISVTASVLPGYSVTGINALLEKQANALHLPNGYSWSTGGVNQQNNESVQSILEAMVLSFVLIIVTMVIQFGSFRRALIVMLVIPLSISGVFIIFALTNTPLSFPALIGVLALFGIVVKNSILVVDKIMQNQKAGLAFIPAIADASSSRLEAIALTSIATIFGLLPITLSNPLWQGLGGAIIAGLTFSGTIMLFFIPVVYYYWFHGDRVNK